jgi:SNF2 family DNA or RNA helicase
VAKACGSKNPQLDSALFHEQRHPACQSDGVDSISQQVLSDKNLGSFHRRLRPIMRRRRKDEVEDQLPPRTVKNHFAGMEAEQRKRYEEYRDLVAGRRICS